MPKLIGESGGLRRVLEQARRVALTDTTVLISGETGTGKELVAQVIHQLSPRRERPVVKLNCAALPSELVESELFGHEQGAFTGATQQRRGRFELADQGTLLLDEVGELELKAQAKLLRVLQEQTFERVGGSQTLRLNARVIAATNRDLGELIGLGRFREDLFYRLSVFPIELPPLRERRGDIPALVNDYLAEFGRVMDKPLRALDDASVRRLQRYDWPGNVRELRNVIERAAIMADGEVVDIGPLPAARHAPAERDGAIATLHDVEREHIRRVLTDTGGVVHGPYGAARILGIHPNTLRTRMQKLGIPKQPHGRDWE